MLRIAFLTPLALTLPLTASQAQAPEAPQREGTRSGPGFELGAPSVPELFGEAGLGFEPEFVDPTVTRQRAISVRTELLRLPSTAVRIQLFEELAVLAHVDRRNATRPGGFTWLGQLEEDAEGYAAFAVQDGSVHGTVRVHDRLFRIAATHDGHTVVSEHDESLFLPCATDHGDLVQPQGVAPFAPTSPGEPRHQVQAMGATAAIVDVLVAYTTQARQASGGTAGIQSLVDLAVLETNLGYESSDIDLAMNLAYTDEVSYAETGSSSTELSRLRSTSDGYMDEVHGWRDGYGADAVCLIVSGFDACGRGYLMGPPASASFASSAFQVTARGCATGYYTFGHEFGHNFGHQHDRANAGSTPSNPYSYGYRTPNNAYRTVMAYSPGSRVLRWSNPDVTYNGWPMGIAHPDGSSADNARSHDVNAPVITAWRASVTCGTEDCNSNGILDGCEISTGQAADTNENGVPDECEALSADTQVLSAYFGGTQTISADLGPAYAGKIHYVLGSISGWDPGWPTAGGILPLNYDQYFLTTAIKPNKAPLGNSFGFLDSQGRSTTTVTTAQVDDVALINLTLYHAMAVLDFPSFEVIDVTNHVQATIMLP